MLHFQESSKFLGLQMKRVYVDVSLLYALVLWIGKIEARWIFGPRVPVGYCCYLCASSV